MNNVSYKMNFMYTLIYFHHPTIDLMDVHSTASIKEKHRFCDFPETVGFKQRNIIFARDIQKMEEGKQLAKSINIWVQSSFSGGINHIMMFNSLVYHRWSFNTYEHIRLHRLACLSSCKYKPIILITKKYYGTDNFGDSHSIVLQCSSYISKGTF